MKRFIQGFRLVMIAALLGLAMHPAGLQADDNDTGGNLSQVTIYVTGMT